MEHPLKPQIILISNIDSTFVRHDESLLAQVGTVKKYITGKEKSFVSFAFEQLRLFFFLVTQIRLTTAVFCWFADYHSFLPALLSKLFRKPFYLIQGGYDTTYIDDIKYGVHTSKLRSMMVDYAIEQASMNLPVSSFLAAELKARYGESLFVEVLHTGYAVEDSQLEEKEDIVLTVAAVDSRKRLEIKGVDRFIELASALPHISFQLVGVEEGLLSDYTIPQNLTVINFLAKPELNDLYKKAKVYGQYSIREGLPNAVLEAMSYECVISALDHSGLSEAVGDVGYLTKDWDLEEVANTISLALKDNKKGRLAKTRVTTHFSEEHRRNRLHEFVNSASNS